MRGLLFCLLILGACSRASDESKAKRSPRIERLPNAGKSPSSAVPIPADLHIDVTIDGVAAAAITATSLEAVTADFHDADRRAWKLTHLIPALDHAGAVVEARGPSGISIRVERPERADAAQPVLYLTRRGEVVVSVLDPVNPFPEYHGQGGQLRRQGDPLPRLSPVAALSVESR